MKTMDFEEFLWANGYSDSHLDFLRECVKEKKPLGKGSVDLYHKLFLSYICVGGFPSSVSRYLENHSSFAATPFDFSDEKNYPILLLTFVSLLFSDKKVSDEVNARKGRLDILVEGRKPNEAGCVVEIKYVKTPSSRARLEKTAEVALAQIENKDYLEILRKDQADPILSYGIVFDPRKAVVKAKKE